jgi:pimeloyl-ACP methyl ester carboxylesterase
LSASPTSTEDFHHALDESLNQHFLSSISDREPGILVGNSLGGWLAIRLALAFPERVRGLVLISPAGAPMSMDRYKEFYGTFRFSRAAEAAEFFKKLHGTSQRRSRGGLQGFLADTGHHTVGAAVGPLVHALFRRPWIETLPRLTRSDHFLTRDDLARLRMPILFIWGKEEKIMIPEMREWYRTHLPPQAEFVEPENFGHCPQLDRPEELTRMIEAFCSRASK